MNAQFFELPAELLDGFVRHALLGEQEGTPFVGGPQRLVFGQQARVARGIAAQLVEAQGDGLEVARIVLQALERRFKDETFADQAPELLLKVAVGGGLRLEGDELLLHRQPVTEHLPDEATDFLRQKP